MTGTDTRETPHGDHTGADAFAAVEFVLCDLDGVVWLAREAIAGAPEAIERLRSSGRRVLFVTNNSMSLIADQEAALDAIGIAAEGEVITSSQAAAALVESGETVLVGGGPGVVEAVELRGARATEPRTIGDMTPDAVIVGLHRDFDHDTIGRLAAAVRDGARFIATNDDATFPTAQGLSIGAGAIVAAVATAAGSQPVIAGKPYGPMADLARQRCGSRFGPDTVVMVGDRWSTDGRFADELGCPFALVRTGVTAPGAHAGGVADIDEDDLSIVAGVIIGD